MYVSTDVCAGSRGACQVPWNWTGDCELAVEPGTTFAKTISLAPSYLKKTLKVILNPVKLTMKSGPGTLSALGPHHRQYASIEEGD